MSLTIQTRLVIGGPARCGKTSLANRIAATDSGCFVLGVDALFRAILRKGLVNRLQPANETARHFLTRRRFQDAARKVAESPLDYTTLDLDTLVAQKTSSQHEHPVRAYARAIDAMAVAAGKTGWVTFDLHPEFAYPRLRTLIPGLKLAIMFRDPREAIAAALYWRRPVETPRHTRREFRRALMLWGMAATAARVHQIRWPEDVCFITLSHLLGDGAPLSVFGINVPTGADSHLSPATLHFHLSDDGFALPDGGRAKLLSERELEEIAALLDPLAADIGLAPPTHERPARCGLRLRIYFWTFAALAKRSPQNAVALMEFTESPFGVFRRRLSLLREAAFALARRGTIGDRPA